MFYGSTEAGTVSRAARPTTCTASRGASACPAILTETRVVDHGELCVRGPLLFDGYLDDPEATAAALEDGWYRTGDVVDVDDEGFFSIVGRARDVIRTGGETVAPAGGRGGARGSTPASPTSRSSACPTSSGARSSVR